MSTPSTLHPLDEAIKLEQTSSDSFNGYIPNTYANMVGPFGGIIAAVMLNSIMSHPERKGTPISITTNFAGPIADAPFRVVTRVIRTNRSNQHWFIELQQNDQVSVTATVILATRRETWCETDIAPPQVPAVENAEKFVIPGRKGWAEQYDFRMISGGLTMDGNALQHSETTLWVKDMQDRTLDFQSLLAISDVFFPRVFVRRQTSVPAGTVSLTTYFHTDGNELTEHGTSHVLGVARGQRFYNGYFDQVAELWSKNGTLLATSNQIVYFKE